MTKSELIADLTARVRKVVKIKEEQDGGLNPQGIKRYNAQVLVTPKGKMQSKSVTFYVVDEGLGTEDAYYGDKPEKGAQFYSEAVSHLDSIIPSKYLAGKVDSVDEDAKVAKATVYKKGTTTTASELTLVILKEGGSVKHRELV